MSNSPTNEPATNHDAIEPSAPPMPPKTPALPLTLILAATPKLGIGQAGQLPWPQLKTEMGYFARVTKRVTPAQDDEKRVNAVIMGRKTWDSIPERFRPLKGRLNVVVTRNTADKKWIALNKSQDEGPIIVSSVPAALDELRSQHGQVAVERVFVIGGSSIYKAALELPQTNRVLLTKIRKEFECDTFFPVNLDGDEGARMGWKRRDKEELEDFAGESIESEMEEKEIRFEFCLYERET